MGLNMKKNESLNLKKNDGGNLTNIRLGLGWDAAPAKGFLSKVTGGSIDLDASAVLLSSGSVYDTVSFSHLTSNDGSVRHTGDNLTGAGDGDDESILVDLSMVPAHVDKIVFTVNSFTGQSFNKVANAFCRVVDSSNGDLELGRYTLSNMGDVTAVVMAAVERSSDGWHFRAVGEPGNGRTVRDLTDLVTRVI